MRRLRLVSAAVPTTLALLMPAVAPAAPQRDRDRQARAAVRVARATMREQHLQAVILELRSHGRLLLRTALGRSLAGVPATTRMHFRSGNVAIAYLTTLLLQLQDERRLSADDPLSKWFPQLPNARQITLRMLADSTSGYSDYVRRDEFSEAFDANPFRTWTAGGLVRLGTSRIEFDPGTAFDYSHTGFVILGEVLRKVTGRPVARLIRERIARPLRLRNSRSSQLPAIPRPVLHSFTSERDVYEESTHWSPSWGTARGANMTADIRDVALSVEAIGEGRLLSARGHRQQLAPTTASLPGLSRQVYYAMGMPIMGGWVVLNPSLAGYGVMAVHHRRRGLTIAAVSTKGPRAGDGNVSELLVRRIAARIAPRLTFPERP